MLLYTREAERLRETLRDVLGWDSVEGHDPPDGWLIFKLPPAELGVHPGDTPQHEFTLMCDDLNSTMAELGEKGIEFRGEPRDQGFGIVTTMVLPGGVELAPLRAEAQFTARSLVREGRRGRATRAGPAFGNDPRASLASSCSWCRQWSVGVR